MNKDKILVINPGSTTTKIALFDLSGNDLKDLKILVAHMGGGITASALSGGKVIDCALYDDGPMAPERSGGVPLLLFKKLCFSEKYVKHIAPVKVMAGERELTALAAGAIRMLKGEEAAQKI